jgi:hypothetical protein
LALEYEELLIWNFFSSPSPQHGPDSIPSHWRRQRERRPYVGIQD